MIRRPGGRSDHIVGWYVKFDGPGKTLGAQQGEVIIYGKDFGFIIKMIYGSRLQAVGGYAEG